jgi:amino acid transporter
LSVVAYVIGGDVLQWTVTIIACLGQFGTLLSSICSCACSLAVLSDLNMLPPVVARPNARFGTPVVSITIVIVITTFFSYLFVWLQASGANDSAFASLATAASIVTALFNALMCIAHILLRRREPTLKRPFKIPLSRFVVCRF